MVFVPLYKKMAMDRIHLAAVSGSLRKDSFNTKLLRAAASLLPGDMTMEIVSWADIPLYNGDLDKPAAENRPGSVNIFRQKLAEADGLLIASPEYNYSMPGALKNALDWASRGENSPLEGKPVALVGATPGKWGTARMQLDFQAIFLYMNMKPVYKPEVLVAEAGKKFDRDGRLSDEPTKKFLQQKLEALRELILQQRTSVTES